MSSFDSLMDIIIKLRDPDTGCPWDIKQDLDSLAPALLDECCEFLDGVAKKDYHNVAEELGDIFFTTALVSYILEQKKITSITEILNNVNNKMILRHPHVFGDGTKLNTSSQVLEQWDKIKKEKEGRIHKNTLDKIPTSLPPLEKSLEIQKKVAKVGFDWDNTEQVFDKIFEEISEVKEEIELGNKNNLELEIGDLLFSVINLSRKLGIDPSLALSRTNNKFTTRFNYVEDEMNNKNITMSQDDFDIMDKLWEEAKSVNS